MAYTTFASKTNGNYTHRLQWELVSQNIAANTSTFNYRYRIQRNVSAANGAWSGSSVNFRATIDGSNDTEGQTFDFRVNEYEVVVSGTKTVTHNADGTRTVNGSFIGPMSFVSSGFPETSASGSFTLPTIPRASTPTFSPTTATAGSSVTISTNRASSSFTHDITYTFGSATGTIGTAVGASTTWTPDLSLLEQIPNAVSGTAQIKVVTWNGGTKIGEKTVNLTIQAGLDIVPEFNAINHEEATTSPDVAALIGAYVQGVSKLAIELEDPDGVYGSTITSSRIQVAGQTINAASGTTGVLTQSGSLNINGRVVDSRGRVYTDDEPITVMSYAPPQIEEVTIQRTNSGGTPEINGTYMKIDLKAAVQSLIVGTQKNDLTYRIKSRERGDTTPWASITADDEDTVGAVGFDDDIILGTFAATTAYEIRIEIEDVLGSIGAEEFVLPTGGVFLHFSKDEDGIGVGKYHEQGSIDTADRMYQRDGKQVIDEDDLADALNPLEVGYRKVVTIRVTTTSAFTKASYPWLRRLVVRGKGGGGGGGGAQATSSTQAAAGGGGGAGAYFEKMFDETAIASLGSSVTMTIGAGGAGSSGNATASNGGTTSFGTHCSAPGGIGAWGGQATATPVIRRGGLASDVATGGDVNLAGQPGQPGIVLAVNNTGYWAGPGADGVEGHGGAIGIESAAGQDGGAGGGGSGASNQGTNSARSGGNGGAGWIELELYA